MSWYPDLTPYTHGPDEDGTTALNVGWLQAGEPFSTGPVGGVLSRRVFLRRLGAAAAAPTGPLFGGTHQCGLCATDGPRGSGEVRVRTDARDPATQADPRVPATQTGPAVLVAPSLIAHYVEAHGYRPPAEFVEAVCAGRIDAPVHQPGEELARYLPDEPLDGEHTAIAVRAVADRAGVWPEAVAARFAFFVSYRLVCERPGVRTADGGGLPRLVLGIDRSGTRSYCTAGGYWDGTAEHLVRIARASITEHTVRQLQDAGWH